MIRFAKMNLKALFKIPVLAALSLAVLLTAQPGVAAEKATKTSKTSSKALELAARKARFEGDVYFVRGGFNVFSGGLDKMAEQLKKKGVKSKVISHRSTESAVEEILKNRKKFGRKPIVLIGHSLGANAIIRMAASLRKHRVKITYMATFAATRPNPIPSNVRKATNYYFEEDGWGRPIVKAKGARGNVKNIDLSKTPGVHHFNIEKNPRLQKQVVRNILRFIRPARSA